MVRLRPAAAEAPLNAVEDDAADGADLDALREIVGFDAYDAALERYTAGGGEET